MATICEPGFRFGVDGGTLTDSHMSFQLRRTFRHAFGRQSRRIPLSIVQDPDPWNRPSKDDA